MVAGDIISEIIKRMKFWGSKFPNATTSFIPNTRGNSFYLIQNRGDNNLPVQIRLSNHGTYLETWTDRKELGDSVDRIDPAHSINISIVFVDNGKSITDDCENQVNCEGCALPICKPQTFDGQNEIGRPFKVYQYVYQSKDIATRYINALTKAIFNARHSGEYKDPLKDLPRAAKPKEFISTNLPIEKKSKYKQNENKQYNNNRNMKRTIKLNESELKRMIAESVKSVLREYDEKYEMDNYKPRERFYHLLQHEMMKGARKACRRWESVGDDFEPIDAQEIEEYIEALIPDVIQLAYNVVAQR